MEKQRVQNCFASDKVHIGHNVNATVRFGNCLNLSIFRFKTDKLTNKLTDGKKQLLKTPSRMHACMG